MKAVAGERAILKNVVATPNDRSLQASKEREEIISALKGLVPGPEGGVLIYTPDEKETVRGMKMRISKAAKAGGIDDVRTGALKDGTLAAWREAKAPRKPRKSGAEANAEAQASLASGGSK